MGLQWRCADYGERLGGESVPVNDADRTGREVAGRHIAWCNEKTISKARTKENNAQ